MYSKVNAGNGSSSNGDAASVASSKRRFGRRRINSDMSEPLTTGASVTTVDEESQSGDPYFMFRSDLMGKLEQVDESLAEFLRIVNETVSMEVLYNMVYLLASENSHKMIKITQTDQRLTHNFVSHTHRTHRSMSPNSKMPRRC